MGGANAGVGPTIFFFFAGPRVCHMCAGGEKSSIRGPVGFDHFRQAGVAFVQRRFAVVPGSHFADDVVEILRDSEVMVEDEPVDESTDSRKADVFQSV
jgi:hypothetical protein